MPVITKCQYPVLKVFIGVKSPWCLFQLLNTHIRGAVDLQRVADVDVAYFLSSFLNTLLKAFIPELWWQKCPTVDGRVRWKYLVATAETSKHSRDKPVLLLKRRWIVCVPTLALLCGGNRLNYLAAKQKR